MLANVAEVAAIYLFKFLDLDDLAESIFAKVLLGSFFIIAMTLISARGIVVSERIQNVLIAIQFGVLIIVSIIALIRVFAATAGAQAITPQLSWLWPSGLGRLLDRRGNHLVHLHLLGLGRLSGRRRGNQGPRRTPGIAAVITTLILVCTYVLVAYAVQSFAGFSEVGIGLNNAMNTDDVLTVLGKPVAGTVAASLLLLTVSVSALSSTQTTILPTARGTLSMAVYEAIPKRFANVHPRYMTPAFGTIVMGLAALFFYLVLTFLSENALADSVASLGLGGGVLLRHHRIRLRLVLPQDAVHVGAKPVLPRHLPADRRLRDGAGLRHQRQGHDRAGLRLYRVRADRRRVRARRRHARRSASRSCWRASHSAPSDSSAAKPSMPQQKSRSPIISRRGGHESAGRTMHLTVGYLATPTGDDGVALASALAKTFDADVDVVLVVREELPDGHPGRAEYQRLLVERGEEWVAKAVEALAANGVSAGSTVLVGESFAESLIGFAEQKESDLIVIGGARDGFFGGHVIGPVSGALLHRSPIPVALAPRGYAEDPPPAVAAVTAAVPTRPGPTIRCRSRSRSPARRACPSAR